MLKIAVNVTTTTKEEEKEEGNKERKRRNVVRTGYPLAKKQQQRKTGRKERQRAKREFKTNDNNKRMEESGKKQAETLTPRKAILVKFALNARSGPHNSYRNSIIGQIRSL